MTEASAQREAYRNVLEHRVQTLKTKGAGKEVLEHHRILAHLNPPAYQPDLAQQAGTLQEFGCRFRKPDANGTYTVAHSQAVANPKNNRVYLFMFESPGAWKTGKQIMDTLVIDDKD